MVQNKFSIFIIITLFSTCLCKGGESGSRPDLCNYISSKKVMIYTAYSPPKYKGEDSSLWKFLGNNNFQNSISPLVNYLNSFGSSVFKSSGLNIVKDLNNINFPLEVAVLHGKKNPMPNIIVRLIPGLTDEDFSAKMLLYQKCMYQMGKGDNVINKVEVGEWSIFSTKIKGRHVAWVRCKGSLVICVGADYIDNLQAFVSGNEPEDKLSKCEEFVKGREIAEYNSFGGFMAFADLKGFSSSLFFGGQLKKFLNIYLPRRLTYFSHHKGIGYRDVLITFQDDISPIVGAAKVTQRHLRLVPEDVDYFSVHNEPLNRNVEYLKLMIGNLPDNYSPLCSLFYYLQDYVSSIEGDVQFTVDELFSTLGPEVSVSYGSGGLYFLADIRTHSAFMAYVDQFEMFKKEQISRVEFMGEILKVFNIEAESKMPFSPAYVIYDNKFLLFSTSLNSLKERILFLKGKSGRSLAESADFVMCTNQIRKGSSLDYLKMSDLTSGLWHSFIKDAFENSNDGVQMFVNPYLLPPVTDKNLLLPIVKSSWRIDGSVINEFYSPFGAWGGLVAYKGIDSRQRYLYDLLSLDGPLAKILNVGSNSTKGYRATSVEPVEVDKKENKAVILNR